MDCARASHHAGSDRPYRPSVAGPASRSRGGGASQPEYWTVFNLEKANEAGAASLKRGREQALLARIRAPGDTFYAATKAASLPPAICAVAEALDGLPGGTFRRHHDLPRVAVRPATRVTPTPNLETLRAPLRRLAKRRPRDIEINAPGTTSTVMLRALAAAGATQVEPDTA